MEGMIVKQETHSPHTRLLAERLISDIRHRGLAVGDRYLTTDEVCRTFGVGKTAVTRTIRHLAEREILVSRQRSGTFVGPGVAKQKSSKVQTIFVLLPAGDPSTSHWLFQPFIAGIHTEIPDVNVQFTFVPEKDPATYVRELVDGPRASGQFAGIVAVSCPPAVYRYLSELRVPAVIYGSAYSAELPIASVDSDNYQCGQLLTDYLIERGHRRIAFLTMGAGRPGNNLFLDGINGALAAAGLLPTALIVRMIQNDIEALRAITKELLEGPNRPTAIITRGSAQVEAVAATALKVGLVVPDDVEIVFDHDQTTPRPDILPYPWVQSKLSFTEITALIGKTLKEISGVLPTRPKRVVIPMEFHQPKQRLKHIHQDGD
jgi:DNA-binding LacI/PurR family transcriptional regulator